ncbi:hypothetical protein SELMODRAFT_80280 [Selaginella moellendorffii]|uniref:DYW domain-containing protein n=1 Tax=Selaginella moellendorffii TaxID=88036 RepID=D8QXP3_SELML|nr:hypothetical protein SELMODRAFT_80280 [Selaginella moellendorffii]
MNLEGIKPDDVSFLGVLSACSSTGCLRSCKRIHSQLELAAVHSPPDLSVENSLVTAYAKCGDLEAAERIFQRIPGKNVVSWTAMLTAYTFHGNGSKALELYDKMVGQSIQPDSPDSVTYVSILNSCSHAGLLAQARHFFVSMVEDHCLAAWPDHWKCMVDVLGRAGRAEDVVRNMPFQPDVVAWNTLLGCCKVHGDARRGALAFKVIVKADKTDASAVMMQDIYEKLSMFKEKQGTERERKEKKALKKQGLSFWSDDNGKVHELWPDLRCGNKENKLTEYGGCMHSKLKCLKYAFGHTKPEKVILILKFIKMCINCHDATRDLSQQRKGIITIREVNSCHFFQNGKCSCE